MSLKKSAVIPTHQANRYIKMLCKHFSHKVNADWSERQGWVAFAMGRCELTSTPDRLEVLCEATSLADLEEVAATIKSHFDRFAQREQLILQWNQ